MVLTNLWVLMILTQCAGLDRHLTIADTDKVVVTLNQPATDKLRNTVQQTLASESVVNRDEFYSSRKTDQFTKVISTERMQLLLDGLATAGFFDHATERALLSGGTQIKLAINDRELIYTRRLDPNDPDSIVPFTRCWAAFLEIYNSTAAYRTGVGLNRVLEEHEQQRQRRGARQ